MALTHNEPRGEPAPQIDADAEAWKAAAAARKYRVQDGKVWSGGAGMLFALDPVPGFATLPETLRPMVFQAVAQYVTNRVGQVAEGDVQAAITACLVEGKAPSANINDAFEKHYMGVVADLVNERRPLPNGATAEQKAAQLKVIEATATKNRTAKFDEFIAAGKAAARNKPVTQKKRRAPREADVSEALDI